MDLRASHSLPSPIRTNVRHLDLYFHSVGRAVVYYCERPSTTRGRGPAGRAAGQQRRSGVGVTVALPGSLAARRSGHEEEGCCVYHYANTHLCIMLYQWQEEQLLNWWNRFLCKVAPRGQTDASKRRSFWALSYSEIKFTQHSCILRCVCFPFFFLLWS